MNTNNELSNLEPDRITQIIVNTKNVEALRQQLIIMDQQHRDTIDKLHHLTSMVYQMNSEMQLLRQQVNVMRAMSMGHGPTPQ